MRFQSLAQLTLSQKNKYVYLFNDFDPTRTKGEKLKAGTSYYNNTVELRFQSNPRKAFNVNLRTEFGDYYTGTIATFRGEMGLRMGYKANVSMNFSYNKIELPEPQNDAELFLIGPRIDITFTKSLFWTTFIQYNNQIDNLNINTRVQWRFAPVSDFFVVYTDNYFPGDFLPKQRSLVLKLNYWLNL